MSWLKRQQPVKLYQSSTVPYVILEDGVKLCFDNCYATEKDSDDYNIVFSVEPHEIKRMNTMFYRLANFPFTVPFSNIESLNDTIIEGRLIKQASEASSDSKSVAIVKPEYIRSIDDDDLNLLSDTLDDFDKSFILVGENIDPQVRLFEDSAIIIPHNEWSRTLVTVAHEICGKGDRKYCWTRQVPELSISCYGVEDSDELIEINDILSFIGVNDSSVLWERD